MQRLELYGNELCQYALRKGDLLIVEGNGSADEIEKCAVWDGSIDDCVHQNHSIRCRPIQSDAWPLCTVFLNSPSGIQEMQRLAVITSGLYNLSMGKIRSILALPPLAEQQRIVAKVDRLVPLCDDLEAKLGEAEAG